MLKITSTNQVLNFLAKPLLPIAILAGVVSVTNLATAASVKNNTLTAATPTAAAAGVLKKGDRGDSVKELQNWLIKAGFYTGTVTGYYGDVTQTAVKNFQQAAGLTADGIFGPATKTKLTSVNSNILVVGSKGEEVKKVQQRLQTLGYSKVQVDGIYGKITEEAVKAFQISKNLPVTGTVNFHTSVALGS